MDLIKAEENGPDANNTLEHDGLDHTSYDTTSILATIEHAYGLAPVGTRDAQVNDMRNVFQATNR